ncbi:4'-phosphopantetheinyl transferase family protein [Lysobacter cavernae]|uniref:4'-phosphopantetheinyl transferase family protein n=1 Tax=Lysobacter cavernae TaxID=1685901 RepID=A0ABV7RM45_9GAMM
MSLSDSSSGTPAVSPVAPLQWAWLPHHHGRPAEPQARAWLAGQLAVDAAALPLARDARQRPWLGAPFERHDINWSHSGDGLLVALGDGVRVGADLERLRPRPRALDLARRYFGPDEIDWLAAAATAQARDHAFLRLWCAKEAVLKAHGHGIAFGLDRVRFAERDGRLQLAYSDSALGAAGDWSLHEFAPVPGYIAALAWRPRR